MFPAQIRARTAGEFSRCEERSQLIDRGKSLSPSQKTDAALKASIEHAFWMDDVLRAIESYEIEVHVKDGVVHLDGHIVGTTSQSRIKNAMRAIPGLLGIQNNLILDDKLTHEVATSLANLEHIYDCKFFTGTSHGLVSLSGNVSDEKVKLLAEKRVAANPNVRAVINNVRVSGVERRLQDQPCLQPTIGETIYFVDGISAVVKQVIINPNNRRVVAMILWSQFANQPQSVNSTNSAQARSPEHLVVVPVDLIRYMTKVSGFLHINSNESERYMDFDPACFSPPTKGWKAPYPYYPEEVLFPVEKRNGEDQKASLVAALRDQSLWEQLLADESLGG